MSCHEALRREWSGAQLLGSAVLPPSPRPMLSPRLPKGCPKGAPPQRPLLVSYDRWTHSSIRKGEMNDGLEKSLRTEPVS